MSRVTLDEGGLKQHFSKALKKALKGLKNLFHLKEMRAQALLSGTVTSTCETPTQSLVESRPNAVPLKLKTSHKVTSV